MGTQLHLKRLVFVTGKGGVGKSTVSLALAQAAASQGKRALWVSLSEQDFAFALYGTKNQGAEKPTRLSDHLWAYALEPKKALHEYVMRQIKFEFLYRLVFENRVVSYFLDATPGLNDLLVLGKIWDWVEGPRAGHFDSIFVDLSATGHGMNTLRIPRVVKTMIPTGPLHKHAEQIDALLHDPARTSIALVTLAEEMPVNETLELYDGLREQLALPIETVFVNAVYADLFSEADLEGLENQPLRTEEQQVLAMARSQLRRFRSQQVQWGRLRAAFQDKAVEMISLPFLFDSEFSVSSVQKISQLILQHGQEVYPAKGTPYVTTKRKALPFSS